MTAAAIARLAFVIGMAWLGEAMRLGHLPFHGLKLVMPTFFCPIPAGAELPMISSEMAVRALLRQLYTAM